MSITPHRFEITDNAINDLRYRLQQTRLPPDKLSDSNSYGFETTILADFIKYWEKDFDFRWLEQRLNGPNHFIAELDGQKIHFVRYASTSPHATPLLLCHGWPGSFLELTELGSVLNMGKCSGQSAFDIVIPSLPGFGFSSVPQKAGMSDRMISRVFLKLMTELGHEIFAVHGGDWGAGIATWMAIDYPERLIGIHLNYIPENIFSAKLEHSNNIVDKAARQVFIEWDDQFGGYSMLQSQTPNTPGFALNDSPAGLCAWLLEKFRAWSDCGGKLDGYLDRDWLLANVSLYWFTQTISSSMRIYFESTNYEDISSLDLNVTVPTYIARFPAEAPFPPEQWVRDHYHVVGWSVFENGGHFPALECPGELAADIARAFR